MKLRSAERGMALIWVTATVLIVSGVVFSGLTRMDAHERMAEVDFTVDGRAYSVSRAGLVDALAWMRRHPSQPVLEFAPRLDLDAEVPIDETDNPTLGLVRTFEISPGLWGRYVVRRGRPMDPFTDLNGNGVYDEGEPFHDLAADEIWPGADPTGEYPFPPDFIEAAAPVVAEYRVALDELADAHGGDTTSEAFETDAGQLRAQYESQLATLAEASSVPVSEAKKLLDSVPVDATEENPGTADGLWTPPLWTRDIAEERGQPGQGTLWRLESRGTVYRMSDSTQPLGRGPNLLLGSASLATEVRRLGISPPASAAICAPYAEQVTIGLRTRVRADAVAIGVESAENGLTMAGGTVIAPTAVAAVPDFDACLYSVFGVDWSQIRSMADVSATAGKSSVYRMISPFTLVVIDGDVTFGSSLPLLGKGILVVDGNLTIGEGSASFFTGVLYVDGNVIIKAPAHIQGTIVATGSVVLDGSGADWVDVIHDPNIVNELLSVMGQYRISRAIYVPDVRLEGWSVTGESGLESSEETAAGPDPWSNFWNDGGTSVDPVPSGEGAAEWWLTR